MTSRTPRDKSDTVSLFPFLAVLLCTMGALLVLLVVLTQKAQQQAIAEAAAQKSSAAEPQAERPAAGADDHSEIEALAARLDEMRRYQQRLNKLREQAAARLHDEQLRLSHLEEHTRRLEHELAKLQIASQQLEAAAGQRIVDQQQAERESARLRRLVEQTQQELERLREQASSKKSYAIVPYKGPNGTYRRPIYIECRRDGVIIQPEGIRLTANDFLAPFDPGNPLAKALRAARGELNARAAKAGEAEQPDPYPLLVVRPDGIELYAAARQAIESWDASFGYEFINEDWSLEYPAPDPKLARVMQHAVMQGRERLAMLVRAAPRRYGRLGIGGTLGQRGSGGSGQTAGYARGNAGSGGFGDGSHASQESSRYGNTRADGNGAFGADSADGGNFAGSADFASSDGSAAQHGKGQLGTDQQNLGSQTFGQTGDSGDAAGSDAASGQFAASAGGSNQSAGEKSAGTSAAGSAVLAGGGSSNGQAGASAAGASQASLAGASAGETGASAGPSSSGSNGSGTNSGGASANAQASAASSPSLSLASKPQRSPAQSRGKNWTVRNSSLGAVPIRRPIQVVVRDDRLAILPSRHTSESDGAVVSLYQPAEKVMDEFTTALREHMENWGLAGNGLYWRPVLMLNVGPNAKENAERLTRLLDDSGVEVRLLETARKNREDSNHATR